MAIQQFSTISQQSASSSEQLFATVNQLAEQAENLQKLTRIIQEFRTDKHQILD
jgi:methyl-accepting chemotaxis protein